MIERSVGLIVMADMPGLGLVAVLRERGYWNFEKMKPESYPGACQVTAHGKLEQGEEFIDALNRELGEELGDDFALRFWSVLDGSKKAIRSGRLIDIYREEDAERVVVTFGTKLLCAYLKEVCLAPESGALRLVRPEEVFGIVDVRSFDKATGIQDRKIIAMFPDEKEAVAAAFARFS